MTDEAGDLLVEIRRSEPGSSTYPVEAELGDGSRYSGGSLTLDQPALLASLDDSEAYGRLLFDALFQGPIRTAFERALETAQTGSGGVGVRLWLDPAAPELEAIRWERIYLERGGAWVPLSAAGVTAFSRYLALPTPEPRPVATRPIRILLAASNPSDIADLGLQPVQVAEEVQVFYDALREANATDDVEVTVLARRESLGTALCASLESDGFEIVDEHATLSEIVRRLSGSHVVHFVGHGSFSRGEPADGHQETALFLEREDGRFHAVTAVELMERFVTAESVPSLVYLSACESGRREIAGAHPFIGLGQGLVGAGVAAVVAMQDVIPVTTARSLTRDFYAGLLTHGLVDRAMNQARAVVYEDNSLAWSVPVVFTRLRRGRLLVERDLANRVIADDVLLTPGPVHGVAADRIAAVPVPRLRPAPVLRLPRDFPGLLGRETEVQGALADLAGGSIVEFAGAAGSGKTALLRHVANRSRGVSADGVIYVANGREPVDDLLVFLFDALYEADASLRPTDADLLRLLAGCSPVIAIDDADVPRDAVGRLIELVPRGRFLLAAEARNLWGEGHAQVLGGLPPEAGLALFERELGRPLTTDERPRAEALCAAFHGHPLHILQAAELTAGGTWPEPPLPGQPGAEPSAAAPSPITREILDALAGPRRDVLAVIAAAGAPIRLDHIEAVIDRPDTATVCQELLDLGLIKTASPRYALAEPLPAAYLDTLDLAAWRARLRSHLVKWIEQNRHSPGMVTRDLDLVIAALQTAGDAADQDLVLRLARGVEGPLILSKRWGRWSTLLGQERALASATGDRAALGWALHQEGSLALALADEATARDRLTQALAIRDELGDVPGAALTRHNLELLGPITPPTDRGSEENGRPKPDLRPAWRRAPWSWMLAAGLIVATVAAVAAVAVAVRPNPPSSPTPRPPLVAFDRDRVDLGPVEVGSSSSASVTLTNEGGLDLSISGVILDPPSADLAVTNGCAMSLPPTGACTITLTFTPTVVGSGGTTLVVTDNTSDQTHSVLVAAEGVALPLVAEVSITPPMIDFGVLRPGRVARRLISVNSSGTGDVAISAVGLSESQGFAIAEEDCATRTFVPATGCSILVTFRPTAPGPFAATLTIIDNTEAGSHSVGLAGSGDTNLPDLQSNLDTIGEAFFQPDQSVAVPIVIHVMNTGTGEAGPFAIGARDVTLQDEGGPILPVGLVLDPNPASASGTGGRPGTLGSLLPGAQIELTGKLVFPVSDQGRGVVVDILPDSCAGEELFDPIAIEHCRIWESDETNNASNVLKLSLPGGIILLNLDRLPLRLPVPD